jgi:hypothetical protein
MYQMQEQRCYIEIDWDESFFPRLNAEEHLLPMDIYGRALVFCAVLTALCVSSLVLLFTEWASTFKWLIVTTQVGVLITVVATIMMVWQYNRDMLKKKEARDNEPVSVCPDYWTRTRGQECVNRYLSADGKYSYTIGRSSTQPIKIDMAVKDACEKVLAPSSDYPWQYLESRCQEK